MAWGSHFIKTISSFVRTKAGFPSTRQHLPSTPERARRFQLPCSCRSRENPATILRLSKVARYPRTLRALRSVLRSPPNSISLSYQRTFSKLSVFASLRFLKPTRHGRGDGSDSLYL